MVMRARRPQVREDRERRESTDGNIAFTSHSIRSLASEAGKWGASKSVREEMTTAVNSSANCSSECEHAMMELMIDHQGRNSILTK